MFRGLWLIAESLQSLPALSYHLAFCLSVFNPPCLPLPRTLLWHLGPSWPNQDGLLISRPLTQAHLHRPFSQIRSHCRFWRLRYRIVFGNHFSLPQPDLLGFPISSAPTPRAHSCPPPPPLRVRADLICTVSAGRGVVRTCTLGWTGLEWDPGSSTDEADGAGHPSPERL